MNDIIEANLPEAQRRVYREEKELNQLFRAACGENDQEAKEALLQLRKVFYDRKRRIETLQQQAKGGDAKRFWAGEGGAEMGRLTNVCRNIVALFNDLGLGLHERAGVASGPAVARTRQHATSRQQRLPRTYQGL